MKMLDITMEDLKEAESEQGRVRNQSLWRGRAGFNLETNKVKHCVVNVKSRVLNKPESSLLPSLQSIR